MENGTIIIPPFAFKVLGLRNADAIVYGVIYGFTIGKQGKFYGNLRFISEITGFERETICRILKKLTEKGFIKKTVIDTFKNEYQCVPYDELVENGIIRQPETVSTPEKPKKQRKTAKTAVDDTNPLPEKENQSMSKIDALQGDFELSPNISLMTWVYLSSPCHVSK